MRTAPEPLRREVTRTVQKLEEGRGRAKKAHEETP